ncbi:MAG: endonuclease/exonuclease/phosphatase family protein [Clostridia bacterium]|nr:endonuclease/exonuclease/phosphatase family protein [Clostridia bacterium]
MKRVLKSLLALLLCAVIAVGAYVAYVFISYYRLDDMMALEVKNDTGAFAHAGEAYRAVSSNIGFGAYSADFGFFMDGGEHARARSREEVAENVTGSIKNADSMDAQIIFFQEVDVHGHRSRFVDQRAMINEHFMDRSLVYAQNYDSPYLFYPIHEPIGSSESGIITVSEFGVTSALRRSLPIDTSVMKLLDLDRCYSVSRAEVDNGRELVMYNVHLSAYTADESIVRGQIEMLAADMAAEYAAGNYVVCGGDFNCDLPGDSMDIFGVYGDYIWAKPFDTSLLPEGLRLIAPVDRNAPVPSARNADGEYVKGESFVVTLDGFIVSDNVEVIASDVIDTGFEFSDHNPVYLDFVLLDE